MEGKVKRFSDFNGYGFIKGENGTDYFVHYSNINGAVYKTLAPGERVSFEAYLTKKGWQAFEVSSINRQQTQEEAVSLKANPFTPQEPIIDPDKFAGRKEVFANAVDCIFNSKNLLITGHRGIGKSSIAYQLLYMAQGEESLTNRLSISLGDYKFNYLIGDYRCMYGNDLNDIVKGILHSVDMRIQKNDKLLQKKTKFTFDAKFLKYEHEETSEIKTASELGGLFVSEIEKCHSEIGWAYNGFVFLIDEIDSLDKDVKLASFLKSVSEKFALDRLINVSFIIAGVTGTNIELISDHPSVSRLFEVLFIKKMLEKEIDQIITLTLANTGISITDEARKRIINLSDCYPQPVHMIGYHAFRLDKDEIIDLYDVNESRDFVVQELKRQEFEGKLYRIGKSVMSEILKAISSIQENEIEMRDIIKMLPSIPEDTIAGNLGGLEELRIIDKPQRGVYRICDPLFKTYLRWVFNLS